jgi:integrase/recombinase XerD
MNESLPVVRVSPLRQRVIDDMNVRRFCRATQRNYILSPLDRLAMFTGTQASPDG